MPGKRIVLSDDEDDSDVVELPKSGFSSSSASKTSEFITPKKEEDCDESESVVRRKTRGSSGRALTSKEKERRKALEQMTARMGAGLAGLDAGDSSEESENAFIDDEDGDVDYEEYDGEDDDEENDIKRSTSSQKKRRKEKKVAQFVIGLPANPSRSGTKPGRRDDTYVSDAESFDSEDMGEFILSKEEEEAEEEERRRRESKARRKAKKEKKKKKKKLKRAAAESLDETVRKGGKSSAKKSPGKKIIIMLDEDEDEGEDEQPTRARNKRQKIVSAESSEDEQSERSSDEDDDDEGEEDDDAEDEALDGPMMYWQVDALAAEERELESTISMRQNFDEGEAVQVYIEYLCYCHLKPGFVDKVLKNPREPTHARYLAAARHIEDRICTVRESVLGSGAWSGKGKEFTWELQQRPFYNTDAYNIDRLRESVDECSAEYGYCAACGRENKTAPVVVYLFGAKYAAREVWNRKQWHLEMPSGAFLHEKTKEKKRQEINARAAEGGNVEEEGKDDNDAYNDDGGDDDDDSDEEDEDEKGYSDVEDAPEACQWWLRKWPGKLTAGKETSWELTGHCRHRTQLYHALLHYKLRLLLKVGDKLERLYGNVNEIVTNRKFCSEEAERFENLLELATAKFGGKGMLDDAVRRVAGVWQDGNGAPSPEDAANRASAQRRSQVSMLQWLSKTGSQKQGASSGADRENDDDDFE